MEVEYKVVCALSNSANFDDLDLSDSEPQFQLRSQYKFKCEYLANDASDPLHVWF